MREVRAVDQAHVGGLGGYASSSPQTPWAEPRSAPFAAYPTAAERDARVCVRRLPGWGLEFRVQS